MTSDELGLSLHIPLFPSMNISGCRRVQDFDSLGAAASLHIAGASDPEAGPNCPPQLAKDSAEHASPLPEVKSRPSNHTRRQTSRSNSSPTPGICGRGKGGWTTGFA